MRRWSYLPKLTCEEAQAEMDEALKADGDGPKDLGGFEAERWWFSMLSPRKKGVDTPNYGKLMKYNGVPNLPRQPHMFTVWDQQAVAKTKKKKVIEEARAHCEFWSISAVFEDVWSYHQ